MLSITPLYAGLLALLFLTLSYFVVLGRRSHKISVGDGENADMRKRMRVQANFVEYAPFGIILLALYELQGGSGLLVHAFGLSLLCGRLLHAYGLGSTPQVVKCRVWGMYPTLFSILGTALANVLCAVTNGIAS